MQTNGIGQALGVASLAEEDDTDDDDIEPDYDSLEYQFGLAYSSALLAQREGYYGIDLPDPVHYGLPENTEVKIEGCEDRMPQFSVLVPDVSAVAPKPHVANNSGNNEWYTPAEYVEAARSVLGKIELDPASSEIANQTIKAKKFYTSEDDGLSESWRGKVWMNR